MKTRIGVFSDSHGDKRSVQRLLEMMGRLDAACFLGDIDSDAAYLETLLADMAHRPPLYAVRGNNDYASQLPDTRLCTVGGKRLYMTHGHLHGRFQVNLMRLALSAKENEADVALFGHTHEALCEYAYGVLLLNPGSAGNGCRGGAARASVLEIDEDGMRVIDVKL